MPQLTADARLTGTARPRRSRRRRRATGSRRRSSTPAAAPATPTTCAARCCASTSTPTARYTIPAGNLFPEPRTRRQDAARRSTRWASATRSGSRSTTTTSPTSPTTRRTRAVPENFRGPAGTGRVEVVRKAVQLRLAAVRTRRSSRTTAGTSTPARRWTRRRRRTSAATRAAGRRTRSRWNTGATSTRRPSRPRQRPADHPAGHLVLLPRQRQPAARHAVPGVLRRLRRHAARSCSPSCTRPASPRTARRRTDYDAGEPEHDEVPAVLRRRVRPRRVQRGHAARGPRRHQQQDLQDQPLPRLRRGAVDDLAVPVRVRQPDGHAVRRRRQLLPADLRRRVLPGQPRRGHVPLGVRQGPARAAGRR